MKTAVCGAVAAMLVAGCASNRTMYEPAGAAMVERADGTAVAIPQDAQAIFAGIDQHQAQLKSAVQANRLSDVHEHAVAIRELTARIPQRGTFDTSDDLLLTSRKISEVTGALDRIGETDIWPESRAKLEELGSLIQSLKAQFKERK